MSVKTTALRWSLVIASVVLVLIITITGCVENTQQEQAFEADFDFAVGISSDSRDESFITCCDKENGAVCRRRIGYGNLSDIFRPGVVKNNVLYVSPEGKSPQRKEHCVLALDLNSGRERLYEFSETETRMLGLSVNQTHIYVSSNLNGSSTISSCAIDSGKIHSVKLEGCIVDYLYAGEKEVYAFGSGFADEEYSLYELEADTLKIRERTKLHTRAGASAARLYEDTLYFSVSADAENYPESKTQLGCYNCRTKQVSWVDFSHENAMRDIEECGGRLLIGHTELPYGTGNRITAFDPESGKKEVFSFEEPIMQMKSRGRSLYILSCSEEDGTGTVTEYRWEKKGFKKVRSVQIEEEGNNEDFYIGSFWLKGE